MIYHRVYSFAWHLIASRLIHAEEVPVYEIRWEQERRAKVFETLKRRSASYAGVGERAMRWELSGDHSEKSSHMATAACMPSPISVHPRRVSFAQVYRGANARTCVGEKTCRADAHTSTIFRTYEISVAVAPHNARRKRKRADGPAAVINCCYSRVLARARYALYARITQAPPKRFAFDAFMRYNRLIRVTRVDNWPGGVTPWFLRNPDVANKVDVCGSASATT